jgi:hypothetical protein
MNLTIDDAESNKAVNYPTTTNATGWYSSTVFGGQTITFTMYRNYTSKGTSNGVNDSVQLAVGIWNYTYHTVGNANYSAASKNYWLTVNTGSVPLHIAINSSETDQNFVYENYTNVTGWSDVTGQDLSFTLWRGNTNISSGNSVSDVSSLGVTTYTYVFNTSGGANYSSNTTSRTLTITQKSISIYLALNGTQDVKSYTYPQAINATAWKDSTTESTYNLTVWRNGTIVASTTSETSTTEQILLGNGTHNYTATLSSTNYTTTAIVNRYAYVNKGDPSSYLDLFIDDAASDKSIAYPTTATVRGNVSTIQGATGMTYKLYRNDAEITSGSDVSDSTRLGNATYTFRYNTTGGNNWTSGAATARTLYVNKGTPQLTLTVSPAWASTYPTATTVTCSASSQNGETPPSLYRNDTDVNSTENGVAVTLGASAYAYVCNTTATGNYTTNTTSNTLTISQNTTNPVNLYLQNQLNQNQTITYGTQSNATSVAVYSNSGTIALYRDESQRASGTSPQSEVITLAAKTDGYAYKVNITGNANYTSNETGVTYYLIINRQDTSITLYLNGSAWTSDATREYPNATLINATMNVTSLSATLLKNGTPTSNPETTMLNVGAYNYTGNYSQTENYSASSSTRILTIQDTIAPTILLYGYTNGTFKKAGDSLTLNISVSDNYRLASIYNCTVYIGTTLAGNITNTSAGWCYGTVTIPTGPSDGNNTLKINATDSQGNVGSNTSYVVDIDNTQPTAAQPTTLDSYTGSTSVTITWTGNPGSDSGSGLNFYEVLRSTDASTYTSLNNTTDSSTTSWTNTGLTAGQTYYYKVRTYDKVNNTRDSSVVSTTIDITAPTVTINTPASGSSYPIGDEVAVNATISDGGSGIATNPLCTVKIGGTSVGSFYSSSSSYCLGNVTMPSGLPSGSTEFNVTVNDKAGNAGSGTTTITISAVADTTPPVVTASGPSGTLSSSGVTIWAYTNEASTCRYETTDTVYANMTGTGMDGAGSYNHTKALTLSNGDYTYFIRCNDTSGNVMTSSAIITFTINVTTTGITDGYISVNGTNAAIEGATVSINATGVEATVSGSNGYYVIANVLAGTYAVTASKSGYTTNSTTATVTAGATTQANITMAAVVDTTAPTVVITSPTNASTTYGSATKLIAVTDENATCRYSTTDQAYSGMTSFTTTGTTTHSVDLTGLTAGSKTYYVRCNDTSGNGNTASVSVTWTVVIDVTTPSSNLVVLSTYQTSTSFTVQWNSSDTDVANYTIRYSTNSGLTWTTWATFTNNSATFVGGDGTTYYFSIRAEDNAGNKETYHTDTSTTIDATRPSDVTGMSPTSATSDTDGAFTWDWDASTDATSGINYYEIQIDENSAGTYAYKKENVTSTYYTITGLTNRNNYTLRVKAVDRASWESSNWNVSGTVTIDKTAPGVSGLVTPTTDTFTNNTRPYYNISVDSDVSYCIFRRYINGAVQFPTNDVAQSNGYCNLTSPTTLSDGTEFYVTVTVNDSVGNTNNEYITLPTYTVDTSIPTITISLPENTTISDTTPTVSFQVQDSVGSSGINTSRITVSDSINGSIGFSSSVCTTTDNGRTCNCTFTSTTLNDSSVHIITVITVDNAGNTNSTTRTFRVDSTLTITASLIASDTTGIADNTYTNGWSFTFNISTGTGGNATRFRMNDWCRSGSSCTGNDVIGIDGNVYMQYINATGSTNTYNVKNSYNESETVYPLQDVDSGIAGTQGNVTIYVKIPVGTTAGSYSTSYAVGLYRV